MFDSRNQGNGSLRESDMVQRRLDVYRSQLPPYSQFRIRARLLDEPGGEPQARLEKVLAEETCDTELAAIARELQQPVFHHDADLGRFELDLRLSRLSRSIPWDTSSIKVVLATDEHGQISGALEVARVLSKERAAWNVKVEQFAASRLLDVKTMTGSGRARRRSPSAISLEGFAWSRSSSTPTATTSSGWTTGVSSLGIQF
jgi:hypothetical protein